MAAMRALWILPAFIVFGCLRETGTSPDPHEGPVLSDENWTPSLLALPEGWPEPQWPQQNPYSPAKAILGRRLFFEKRLSGDSTINCSWCHSPYAAFADSHRSTFSVGITGAPTRRNTPTLANLVFASSFMYDGGSPTLESQVFHPLFGEMGADSAELVLRLLSDTLYVRLFRQAYGEGPITLQGIAKALATYQRTLISTRSGYDRWRAGDSSALSASAKRGAEIFLGERGGCARCHTPPLFTDGKFHNVGLGGASSDSGRALVTGKPSDIGRFKTPTLRDVEKSAPYMHDGSIPALEDVVHHFNAGGVPGSGADSLIRPLGLNEEDVSDLVEFMRSLTENSLVDGGPGHGD